VSSEQKNAPDPETMEALPIEVDTARLRAIIEDLRQLPNVSDMAVISAIAELDRIAKIFERAQAIRERMIKSLANAMRESLLEITPNCDCPRCTSLRAQQQQPGSGAKH
jgi:hypothetical protein